MPSDVCSVEPNVIAHRNRVLCAILVSVTVLGTGFAWFIHPGIETGVLAAGGLAQLLASLTVLWTRRRPELFACAVVLVGLGVLGAPEFDTGWWYLAREGAVVWLPLALALSTQVLVLDVRDRVGGAVGTAALGLYMVAVVVRLGAASGAPILTVLGALSPIGAGALLALWWRLRDARRDRLEALRREHEYEVRQAVADERHRIALEMHDTVTHHLTLLVMHARSLSGRTRDPDTRENFDEVARRADETLGSLRMFVRRMEEAPEQVPPPHPEEPSATDLEDQVEKLITEARDAGQPVELDIAPDAGQVPVAVSRAVARVVQEAMTNARKYAPGSAVTVTIASDDGALTVRVHNPLNRAGRTAALTGSTNEAGLGLTGLRRRVTLLGGTFEAGPRDEDFDVVAVFPLPGERVTG